MKPSIELIIDELILHGFAASDRHRVAEAVQQELTAMLTSGALSLDGAQGADLIDAGSFQIAPGAKAHSIGAAIGASIATSIAGGNAK